MLPIFRERSIAKKVNVKKLESGPGVWDFKLEMKHPEEYKQPKYTFSIEKGLSPETYADRIEKRLEEIRKKPKKKKKRKPKKKKPQERKKIEEVSLEEITPEMEVLPPRPEGEPVTYSDYREKYGYPRDALKYMKKDCEKGDPLICATYRDSIRTLLKRMAGTPSAGIRGPTIKELQYVSEMELARKIGEIWEKAKEEYPQFVEEEDRLPPPSKKICLYGTIKNSYNGLIGISLLRF